YSLNVSSTVGGGVMSERPSYSSFRVNLSRLLAALVLCCPLWIASGQTTTATLFGVVHDNSGAVVPEAKITARNTATSFTRTVSSNETGAYLITNLPLGPYS